MTLKQHLTHGTHQLSIRSQFVESREASFSKIITCSTCDGASCRFKPNCDQLNVTVPDSDFKYDIPSISNVIFQEIKKYYPKKELYVGSKIIFCDFKRNVEKYEVKSQKTR